MNIVYIAFCSNKYSGVEKKIIGQYTALKTIGVNLNLLLILDNFPDKSLIEATERLERVDLVWPTLNSSRLSMRKWKIGAIEKYLSNSPYDSSIVFIRYPGADFFFYKLLRHKGKHLFVSEHQSIIVKGIMIQKGYLLRSLSEKLFCNLVRRNIDAFVGVTNEITSYQLKFINYKNIPNITIPNGITVSSIPVRIPPNYHGDRLEILCLAHLDKWHGLDRVLRGMAYFKVNTRIRLHIVGDGPELTNIKSIVSEEGLQDNVIIYGFRTKTDLDKIFNKTHIAIGSLAIHRYGMNEACVLKVREYCARGIPFIYSPIDQDFPKDFPYRLKVPADESPIDIKALINFAEKVLKDKEHPQKMRSFAIQNLDWSVKMEKLKKFLEEVMRNSEKHENN